jgi:hypothetical protein
LEIDYDIEENLTKTKDFILILNLIIICSNIFNILPDFQQISLVNINFIHIKVLLKKLDKSYKVSIFNLLKKIFE